MSDALRKIPAVEILLEEVQAESWMAEVPRRILVDAVRAATDRANASAGKPGR